MMTKNIIKTVLLCISVLPTMVYADRPITTDSRIRTFVYGENEVFQLVTKHGYQSYIEFAKNEKILTLSMGNATPFKITPAGNRLFVKAMQDNQHTNMTVLTNKRAYQFELSSITEDETDIIYVMRFYYPDDDFDKNGVISAGQEIKIKEFVSDNNARGMSNNLLGSNTPNTSNPVRVPTKVAPQPALVQPAPVAVPTPAQNFAPVAPVAPVSNRDVFVPTSTSVPVIASPQPNSPGFNFDYSLAGPDSIAPLKIFDDGRATYFKMPSGISEKITVYVVNSNGTESPLKAKKEGEYIIVDNILPKISIRSGADVICVYNESINQLAASF